MELHGILTKSWEWLAGRISLSIILASFVLPVDVKLFIQENCSNDNEENDERKKIWRKIPRRAFFQLRKQHKIISRDLCYHDRPAAFSNKEFRLMPTRTSVVGNAIKIKFIAFKCIQMIIKIINRVMRSEKIRRKVMQHAEFWVAPTGKTSRQVEALNQDINVYVFAIILETNFSSRECVASRLVIVNWNWNLCLL